MSDPVQDALAKLVALEKEEPEYPRGKWVDAWAAARAALAQPAQFSEPVVLPDGSAVATASFPLPADHWLYAPRGEWDSERDDFAETPLPILTNAQRDAVRAAGRYAVRGATMCGKEMDFDPDALVLNLCYALCGPANGAALPADTAPPAPQPERIASGHASMRVPVEATDPDIVLHDCRVLIERQAAELAALQSDIADALETITAQHSELAALRAERVPLTDEQALTIIRDTPQEDVTQEGWITRQRLAWVRAIERAHNIKSKGE